MSTTAAGPIAHKDLYMWQPSSAEEIAECWPVLRILRPQLSTSDLLHAYVARQRPYGYQLLAAKFQNSVVGVAGWRTHENLIYGPHIYIDDLVVLERMRGRRVGASLLRWLRTQCSTLGVGVLLLDTAEHNGAAHRFYEREGMQRGSRGYLFRIADGSGE